MCAWQLLPLGTVAAAAVTAGALNRHTEHSVLLLRLLL
jgi:hypothetical protein